MSIWLRIVLYAVLAYLGLCVLTWIFQRRIQYFPSANPPLPRGETYRDLREVEIVTADGERLKAWHWPGTRAETLLVLHGNGGARGHRLDWMEPFHHLGWSLLLPDYRGYGGSSGSPTEAGLYRDAEASLAWLKEQGVEWVALVGESIGCSVAVDLAARDSARGLVGAVVLQSATISILAVAQHHYPFLPVGLLMKDRYESEAKLGRITAPLLCIHGTDDRIIPIEFGRALFDRANEPKEWWQVEGGRHNDVARISREEFYPRVQAFLERALSRR